MLFHLFLSELRYIAHAIHFLIHSHANILILLSVLQLGRLGRVLNESSVHDIV